MKKTATIILAILLAFTVVGCGEPAPVPSQPAGVVIPDVSGTDETTAKNILSSNGLVPAVKYEYDNIVDEGLVIETVPVIGTSVGENAKVTVYVSKGPSYLESKDSRIRWWNLDGGNDEWSFHTPTIIDGTLHINCTVKFGRSVEWRDTYGKGYIIGVASITDSFDKTIPVKAMYKKKDWKANEEQSFHLEIPLADLDVSRPTDMYLELFTENRGNVRINFYMTW